MVQRQPMIVVAGVVSRDGRILATRRKPGAHLEGFWEFPGGKLEPHESPEESLIRELHEELGVRVRVDRILDVVFHRYPEGNVLILFFSCELEDGEPKPLDVDELAWVSPSELLDLQWAPADVVFVRRLAESTVAP